MPNTRLRIDDAITDEELEKLIPQLKQHFPEGYTIIRTIRADFKAEFQKRMDSLHEAMEFILQATPPSSLVTHHAQIYLNWCKSEHRLTTDKKLPDEQADDYETILKAQVDDYQAILINYKEAHIALLHDYWDYDRKKAEEYLNRAEQFVINSKGRQRLATLCKIPKDFYRVDQQSETFYTLQENTPIDPYVPQTVAEFKALKASNAPSTPKWFRDLPVYQQLYLNKFSNCTLSKLTLVEAMVDGVDQLIQKIVASQQPSVMDKIVLEQMNAEGILLNDQAQQLLSFKDAIRQFSPDQCSDINRLPLWYLRLDEVVQKYIRHFLSKFPQHNIEEALKFCCSRCRIIPLAANFAETDFSILSQDGSKCYIAPKRGRVAYASSRELLNEPEYTQDEHILRVIQAIVFWMEANRFSEALYTTLISPTNDSNNAGVIKNMAGKVVAMVNNTAYKDSEVNRRKNKILSQGHPIQTTNHSINYGATVCDTASTHPQCVDFLNRKKQSLMPKIMLAHLRDSNIELNPEQVKSMTGLFSGAMPSFALENFSTDEIITINNTLTETSELSKKINDSDSPTALLLNSEEIKAIEEALKPYYPNLVTKLVKFAADDFIKTINNKEELPDEWKEWQWIRQHASSEKIANIVNLCTSYVHCIDYTQRYSEEEFAEILNYLSDNYLPEVTADDLDFEALQQKISLDGGINVIAHAVRMQNHNHKSPNSTARMAIQIAGLLGSYSKLLDNPNWGLKAKGDREFYLALYESLITSLLTCLSINGCASAKDRTGIIAAYIDAAYMLQFFLGLWPNHDETLDKSLIYNEMVKWVYDNLHALEAASENAPGAFGVKTPHVYFTAGVNALMSPIILSIHDRLASNNEIRDIGRNGELPSARNWMEEKLLVAVLDDVSKTDLLDCMNIILGEKKYFNSLNSKQLLYIIKDDECNTDRKISEVCKFARDNLQDENESVKRFCNILTRLYTSEDPQTQFRQILTELNELKEGCFIQNRKSEPVQDPPHVLMIL